MAYLPGGGEVRLRFVAVGPDEADCLDALEGAERRAREVCGEAIYGRDGDPLEAVVGRQLADRGLQVATAESCTAGLLSARLAAVPGASRYLRGGLVAYGNEVKEGVLGVDAALLAAHGAVSEPVAAAMAERARAMLGADVGLSVTCAAGPDPQEGAEPGTTFIGVSDADGTVVRELHLPGDREQVRTFATTFVLNLLRLRLAGER